MDCPNCKTQCEPGYGMAGGGCGVYFYCESCDFFEKFQDPDMNAQQTPKQSDVPSRD